jgi:small subunit ribosomal protein S6
MRTYEVVFIVNPELDETALAALVEKVKNWITEASGTVEKVEMWGKRRMTYLIRKQREGQYVFLQAQMAPAYLAELDRNMRFLEPVMRYLITAA